MHVKVLVFQNMIYFCTVDLYENKNIPVVVDCIYSLGAACNNIKGYSGPVCGARRSDKSEFNFTEEQLLESKNQVSFQSSGGIKVDTGKSIRNEIIKGSDSKYIVDKKKEEKKDDKKESSDEDVFAQIEKLATLKEKGILSEEEFVKKKKQLLGL